MNNKEKLALSFVVSTALIAIVPPLVNSPLNADTLVQNKSKKETREDRQFRAYSNSKYNYEDAEVLAEFWGLPDPWDAKLKIGSLILRGKDSNLKNIVSKNRKKKKNDQESQINAFSSSKYNYDDAEQLSYFWGLSSPWDAKLKIGSLILSKNETVIERALTEKKDHDRQFETYSNSKFSYDDAVLLAEFWGLSDPWDAKLKIGKNIINGNEEDIKKQLKEASSR
ncbi:MAG: hypothetical protein KDK36_15275 [Leptospiraceae bacterium]|nr:hypothetical protein [Leptospiraceae bacterium]